MKKLKKGLSLLLVLAMVFSLASTAFAWETNYEDDDQIVQKEAVEVLSAMGIIEGDNGKFDPTGNFTREQAAKIVTYLALGPDAAESLQITANNFSDVAATRWSAKYIAYAQNQEIVMGDGNGKFRPADNVSRIEWLKMLLVSLGIDPDDNGLGDDPNWAANTQSLAVRSGLVTGKELALDWNRDTAVLYAFNAMQLAQDTTWQKQYVYTGDAADYKFIRQYAPTLYKITNTYAADDAKEYTDEYGRTYTAWADSYKEKDATIYAKDYEEAVAVYENQTVSLKTLEKDLDIADSTEILVYTNGSKGTKLAANSAVTGAGVGGRGSVVEVYDEEDYYKIVVIDTFVAKVGTIAKGAKTVTLKYGSASSDTIDVPVADLAKGDVVSFNIGVVKSVPTAYNVTKLEGSEVTVTATGTTSAPQNETYVRIDGEQVFASAKVYKDTQAKSSTFNEIKTGTVYYDTYGNILFYENDTKQVAKAPDGYALVYATQQKAASTALIDSASAKAAASIVDLSTGKVSVVSVAVVQDAGNWYFANKFGGLTKVSGSVSNTQISADADETPNTLMAYYVLDDGSYVLEALPTAISGETVAADLTNSSATLGDVITQKGQATLAGVTGSYADANTKLTVITVDQAGARYTASTVTGIANFSTVTAKATGATKVLATVSDGKITNIVVIDPNSAAAATPVDSNTYAMLKEIGDNTINADGSITYNYTFVVNGVETAYTTEEAIASAAEGAVYKISTEGRFTADAITDKFYSDSTNTTGSVVVKAITSDYIVVEKVDDVLVTTPASETLVYIDQNFHTTNTTPDSEGLVVGATVNVYINDAGNAVYVVVK